MNNRDKRDTNTGNIVFDEPTSFFYVNSTYDIKYAGKHKTYDAAFEFAESVENKNDKFVLLYFDKNFGIELFEEFLYFLKGENNG